MCGFVNSCLQMFLQSVNICAIALFSPQPRTHLWGRGHSSHSTSLHHSRHNPTSPLLDWCKPTGGCTACTLVRRVCLSFLWPMREPFDLSSISRVQKSRIENIQKSIILERTGKEQEVQSDGECVKSAQKAFKSYQHSLLLYVRQQKFHFSVPTLFWFSVMPKGAAKNRAISTPKGQWKLVIPSNLYLNPNCPLIPITQA